MCSQEEKNQGIDVVDAVKYVGSTKDVIKQILTEFSKGINKGDPGSLWILFLAVIFCIFSMLVLVQMLFGLILRDINTVQYAIGAVLIFLILIVIAGASVTVYLQRLKLEYEFRASANLIRQGRR